MNVCKPLRNSKAVFQLIHVKLSRCAAVQRASTAPLSLLHRAAYIRSFLLFSSVRQAGAAPATLAGSRVLTPRQVETLPKCVNVGKILCEFCVQPWANDSRNLLPTNKHISAFPQHSIGLYAARRAGGRGHACSAMHAKISMKYSWSPLPPPPRTPSRESNGRGCYTMYVHDRPTDFATAADCQPRYIPPE